MLQTLRLAVFGAAIAAAMLPARLPAQSNAHYVLGKPYQFDGVWYQPAVDYGYDQTGIASIYPPSAVGLSTTSGEAYDENAIAGAHKTLPLPCMVRITNLENGKSIALRLNDRGPFVDDRIVALTPAAARALGVTNQTSLQVRVQIMAKESQALADSLQPGGGVSPAPAPVVKVTTLPLASGTAIQPMKPVAAQGSPPPLPPQPTSPPENTSPPPAPAVAIPAASPPAPQAATAPVIPLAIPLPEPAALAQPPAPLAQPPAAPAPPPAKPSPPPATASTPATTPAPDNSAASAATVHVVEPTVAPALAAPVVPAHAVMPAKTVTAPPAQPVPEVSVNVTNATVPPASTAPASTPPAQPAIPIQLTSAPAATDTGKIKPLPVDLPAQFFIQTGAFKKTADADSLRDKLTSLAPAKVVPTRLGAQDFSAVLLGPIPTMSDAQRLLKQITGMGYSDAVLIIE